MARSRTYGDNPGGYCPDREHDDAYVPEWSEPPWSDDEGEFSVPEGSPHTGNPNGRPPTSCGSAAQGHVGAELL